MSLISKELQLPSKGLRYELGPELIEEVYTPKAKNVHEVNGEIRTKPGVDYFNDSDLALRMYLRYDQNDDSQLGLRTATATQIKLAQSITTVAAARTVNSITLKLKRNGTISTGDIWLTIEPDSSGPTGSAITNGTSTKVLASSVSATAGWVTFSFTTPFTLTSSTVYWIVLQGDYSLSGSNYIEWEMDSTSSPYTDGAAYKYDASWATTGANQDFMFRMYRDTAIIMFSDTFTLTSEASYLMVATLDRLFYWNDVSDLWIDISGFLVSNLFSGLQDDFFSYAIDPATDTFIITNYVNSIKKWTTLGDCENLGGTPPRCKFLKMYKNRLFFGNVYNDSADRPYRLMWADAGDIESGATGYHDFLESNDYINGLFLLNDYLVCTKDKSIYVGYSVSSTTEFQFDRKVSGSGPISGRMVIEKKGYLLMACLDDIILFDGASPTSIADTLVLKEFLDLLEPSYLKRGFSIDVPDYGEWHLFVCSAGETIPQTEWVYNYKKGEWWKYSISVPVTCAGNYIETSTLTIDDLVGTIDQQIWRINDRSILGFNPSVVLGTSTGRLSVLNNLVGEEFGAGVEAYVDTKDFSFTTEAGKRIRGKINGITFKASGSKCYLYYSTNLGLSYTLITPTGISLGGDYTTFRVKFRVNSENIRFRVYKSAVGESFNLRNFSFDVQPGGRI